MADLNKKRWLILFAPRLKRVENKSAQEDFKDLDRKIGKQLEKKSSDSRKRRRAISKRSRSKRNKKETVFSDNVRFIGIVFNFIGRSRIFGD